MGWTKGLIIRTIASRLLSLGLVRREPRVGSAPASRAGAAGRGAAAQEVREPQAADGLHLAQRGAQLLRRRAAQPARQLPGHRLAAAEARGQHEGEAEARSVPGVELRQPEPLFRAQARQARGALLSPRLGRQRAPLQLAARQVRVAAQDALLACREAQSRGRSALRKADRADEATACSSSKSLGRESGSPGEDERKKGVS